LGNQKTPKRADGDSLRNIGGGQIYKYTTHAAPRIAFDSIVR
jgi:hypothetical protein